MCEHARLRALVWRLLVFGEDWCPDVYRGLPVARRIAERRLELRVLERDQLAPSRTPGDFLISVFVFLDENRRVIAHWIGGRSWRTTRCGRRSAASSPSGTWALTEKLGRPPTGENAAAKREAQVRYDAFQASSPYWAGGATVIGRRVAGTALRLADLSGFNGSHRAPPRSDGFSRQASVHTCVAMAAEAVL
jgi:hypothetical protein